MKTIEELVEVVFEKIRPERGPFHERPASVQSFYRGVVHTTLDHLKSFELAGPPPPTMPKGPVSFGVPFTKAIDWTPTDEQFEKEAARRARAKETLEEAKRVLRKGTSVVLTRLECEALLEVLEKK